MVTYARARALNLGHQLMRMEEEELQPMRQERMKEIFERGFRRYREALRELARS